MNYVVWGAGKSGRMAVDYFGYLKVEYIIDRDKAGERYLYTDIVSLEEILPNINNYIVIIASENYYMEMAKQLKTYGVKRFFIFREYAVDKIASVLPYYVLYGKIINMSYCEVLLNYHISKYKKICLYGINEYIYHLLAEISFQNNLDNIAAIVDENISGEIMGMPIELDIKDLWGIPVVSEINDDILEEIDCLIINKPRKESLIREKLPNKGKFDVIDIYDIDKFIPLFCHQELIKYKNIYNGKRVFIVGNGPSLRFEDLEILHKNNEICFGCNMVWKAYDRTDWRASYLLMSDFYAIQNSLDIINDIKENVILSDAALALDIEKRDNIDYVHMIFGNADFYPNYPGFSEDITKGFFLGQSIVYDIAIQLAAYMGFNEIYLIGVDNSYSNNLLGSENHFIKDYYNSDSGEKIFVHNPKTYSVEKAFEKAEKYSREHDFRIFNATRGGSVEAFERINFDELFK